jgi:hypothetical protein
MEKTRYRGGVFHPAEQCTSVRYSISAPAVPEKERKYPGHAGHHHESKRKKRKSFVQVKVTQYVRSLAKQTPVSSTKSRSSSSEQPIFRSRRSSDGGKGGAKQLKLHTYCIELGTCSGHKWQGREDALIVFQIDHSAGLHFEEISRLFISILFALFLLGSPLAFQGRGI